MGIRGNIESKSSLLFAFLPLVLLVISGSVFGTYLGPLLCLLGAIALPCGMAKLHQPEGRAISTIGSIFASSPSRGEDEEEMEEQIDSEEEGDRRGRASPEYGLSSLSPIKEESPPPVTEQEEPHQKDSPEVLPLQKDRPEAASEEPPPLAETDSEVVDSPEESPLQKDRPEAATEEPPPLAETDSGEQPPLQT